MLYLFSLYETNESVEVHDRAFYTSLLNIPTRAQYVPTFNLRAERVMARTKRALNTKSVTMYLNLNQKLN